MNKKFLSIILSAILVIAASVASAEQISLKFDDRQWGLGYESENKEQGIREYVLSGETVEKWTELVTVQAFFGLQLKASPEDYMNEMVKSLKEACPGATWKLVHKSDSDALYEWQINDCKGQEDQFEIDRVIQGDRAMYIVHYASKKLPVKQAKRDEWIKLLESVTLIND